LKISLQGEHSCRWLKKEDDGKEAGEILKLVSISKAKASLAFVCSDICNEKVKDTKRAGGSGSGEGASKKQKN